jgi:hypothetical protein
MKKLFLLLVVAVMVATFFSPFAAEAAPQPFTDFYLLQPGAKHAIITPVYAGMSRTIGQPALIDVTRNTGRFPVFEVRSARAGTTVSGQVINPSGAAVHTITSRAATGDPNISIPDTVPLVAGTYRVTFTLVNGTSTFHDSFYFTAINNFTDFRSTANTQNSNNSNVANIHPDRRDNVHPALRLENGRLVYFPDYRGNRVMDYSRAGYRGGGVAIPFVPTAVTVAPHANPQTNMTPAIQAAINQVSALPLVNGFRGAVELEAGVYRLSTPIYIEASGVVLRGAGMGVPSQPSRVGNTFTTQRANEGFEAGVTKLIATFRPIANPVIASGHQSASNDTGTGWREGLSWSAIQIRPANNSNVTNETGRVNITDQYLGTGATAVNVTSASGFAAGQTVRIQKTTNVNWVRAMYMDRIDGANTWLNAAGTAPVFTLHSSEHTIRSVSGNTIHLYDPLPDNLDMRWGISTLARVTIDNRIFNVGVENLQAISNFQSDNRPSINRYGFTHNAFNDENHSQRFIFMDNVRDGWARNFTTYHFDRAFEAGGRSRNVTVQDIWCLDPVSQMNQGERRYSFYVSGRASHIFFQRLYSRYARHAFSTASLLPGPNVFYNCEEEFPSNTSEPHFRWATGGLFDNVTSRIAIQNRWNWGTSHGHAGVNWMMYNCTGVYIISQPQLTPNWIIGFNPQIRNLGTSQSDAGRGGFGHSTSANLTAAGLNGGRVPNMPAYEFRLNRHVNPAQDAMPNSIYVQQLIDRTGNPNVEQILNIRTVLPPPTDPIPNPDNDLARGAGSVLSGIGLSFGNQNGAFNTSGGRGAVFAFDGNPDGRLDGQIDYARMYSDPAINANPNNGGTFWATTNAHPSTPHGEVAAGGMAWLSLDYNNTPSGTVTFNEIHIYPRDDDGQVRAYRIETGNDGINWTSIVHSTTPLVRSSSGTPARDVPIVHTLPNHVTARYVRFVVLNSQSTGMYGIRGLELYLKLPPLPEATARGIAGDNANDAPRARDLNYGATTAISGTIPRAVSGGDVNTSNGRHTEHAFTDDYSNFWQLLSAVPAANKWLAVDYRQTTAQTVTFNRVVVQARQDARPTHYNIEVMLPNSNDWTVVFTEGGSGVSVPNGLTTAHNRGTEITFAAPITASQVRVRVLESTGAGNNIQLTRFALYRTVWGDIDGDGYISSADATMLRRLLAQGSTSYTHADLTQLRFIIAVTNPF